MKNVEELRDQLAQVFTMVKNKQFEAKEASALANISGKMLSAAKLEMAHAVSRKEQPNIEFLKSSSKK